MTNLLWSVFLMLLLLSGCGQDVTPTRHNDFAPLTSIEIVAVSPTIAAGTSQRLSVQGNFAGLFTRDVTNQAVWSSDSPAVAGFVTASSPNRVSGHAPGTATLTATVGSVSATFRLTISSATVTAVTVTPAAPSTFKGLNTQFAASGAFSDGSTQDLTFDAAWASSDPTVATVSDDPGSKGLAHALAVGAPTISATFGGKSGTALLTVAEAVLQSITVSTATPTVLSLSSASFKASGHFSDGSDADITDQVAWTSSRSDIATIGAGGAAKAIAQGTASISASLTGISGTSSLKVTGGKLTAITLTPAAPKVVQGTLARITATGTFDNGTTRDITGAVQWSVANTAFATVTTPGGNLAFVKAISATPVSAPILVSATSGTITSSSTPNLTVTNPTLNGLTITPASLDLTVVGAVVTSGRFTVTGAFSDGSQDLTSSANWSSSAPAIATVGNTADDTDLSKGRVKGVATGTITISAGFGGQTAPPVNVINNVTVTARTLLSLAPIAGGPSSFVPGNQGQFTLTANFNGKSQVVTEDAAWSIDNANVAVLADSKNQPGLVVLVDRGTATLTASFGGRSQTFTITVP